jgi:hypothetical protein
MHSKMKNSHVTVATFAEQISFAVHNDAKMAPSLVDHLLRLLRELYTARDPIAFLWGDLEQG